MRHLWSSILALCVTLSVMMTVSASASVYLYVDAAPNKFGSSQYPIWENGAFSAASSGSFVNMASGINPANVNTTNFEIQDEVVYSFGDLGKRLTWVYWVPNTTVAALTGNFEIRLENWWDGDYQDFYLDYYGSSWLAPTSWVEYEGGVIGTAGMAWWGAHGVNTPEALQADIDQWIQATEDWTFTARLRDGAGIFQNYEIDCHRDGIAPVPEPSTMILLGGALLGAAVVARRKRK